MRRERPIDTAFVGHEKMESQAKPENNPPQQNLGNPRITVLVSHIKKGPVTAPGFI